jgi:hypothetical protein
MSPQLQMRFEQQSIFRMKSLFGSYKLAAQELKADESSLWQWDKVKEIVTEWGFPCSSQDKVRKSENSSLLGA